MSYKGEREKTIREKLTERIQSIRAKHIDPQADLDRSMKRVDDRIAEKEGRKEPRKEILARITEWDEKRQTQQFARDQAAIPQLKARNERLRLEDQASLLESRISKRRQSSGGGGGFGAFSGFMGNAYGNLADTYGFAPPPRKRREKSERRGGGGSGKTIHIHIDGGGKRKKRR